MSFETELLNKQFDLNVIVLINGVYYGGKTPDSGLSIDADKIGLVRRVRAPNAKLDIRRSKTTIGSISFDMVDKDNVITNLAMSDDSNLLETEVTVYAGFMTGSFDFSDYREIGVNIITGYTKSANVYAFKAEQPTVRAVEPVFQVRGTLDADIISTDTTLTMTEDPASQGFDITGGRILIDNEYMIYTSISGNDFLGLSRGDENSVAEDYDEGTEIQRVDLLDDNPINIMLQILTSINGDGTNGVYDTISAGGLGIDQSLIDVTEFESIRDTSFATDNYRIISEPSNNGLSYMETELSQPTNTRFITSNGKISIAILDQLTLGTNDGSIPESSIVGTPRWSIDSKKVVNKIIVQWQYSYGENFYSRTTEFTDAESITRYGEKKALTFKFKGINELDDGISLVTTFGNRLLSRLSTARPKIRVTTHFDKFDFEPSQDVLLSHRYLPQQGGTLGFSDELEIMSKAFDLDKGTSTYDLEFTSFSNLRIGLIAPSPFITSVVSDAIVNVPDGDCFAVGYCVRLFDTLTNSYVVGSENTILSISTNTLTMQSNFNITPLTTHRLRFCDYNNASDGQKSRYAFTAPNTGTFDDGSQAYNIFF